MSIDLRDPPTPTMPLPELSRRRAHLLGEIERAPVRVAAVRRPSARRLMLLRPRTLVGRTGGRVALALVFVTLTAVVATVLPGQIGRTHMTLVDQAIAAIGSAPTIHVVLDFEGTASLVDLRTGKTTQLRSRTEVWSDPKFGTLSINTLDGRPTATVVALPSQRAAARAWWGLYVSGYRSQLRSGDYHVVGAGTIDGQSVDWIADAPISMSDGRRVVTEIAISKLTYKPLFLRQRINGVIARDTGVRVLRAETLPRRPALFARRVTVAPGTTGFPGASTGIPTTLRAARAAMRPDPIVPPARIAGLRRTWIGLPDYLAPPYTSYRDQVGGVALYYGRLDGTGHPSYQGSYITINEFPRADALKLWGPGLFREDAAIVTARHPTATLKTHGLYLVIQAGKQADALAAARAITH
jgi:hypothetical protein